mgnify:CR=1 FL=1
MTRSDQFNNEKTRILSNFYGMKLVVRYWRFTKIIYGPNIVKKSPELPKLEFENLKINKFNG